MADTVSLDLGTSNLSASVVVVGAGTSGLLAAITAARAGADVLLIDGNDRVGRKLLSTGNGRCNFANRRQDADCYRSENPETVQTVLKQFPLEKVLSFFEEIGIRATERNGYYYPYTNAAADVRDCLEMEIRRLGVRTLLGWRVTGIEKKGERFVLRLSGGDRGSVGGKGRSVVVDGEAIGVNSVSVDVKEISAEVRGDFGFDGKSENANGDFTVFASSCILATGGKAFPKSGSDGFGYRIARSFGHRVIPVAPALVELRCNEKFFRGLKGIRLTAGVRLLVDGEPVASDIGEVQLTERGISGIPVFNVSRFAAKALMSKQKAITAELDFLPELSEAEALDKLKQRLWEHGWGKTVSEAFRGLLHPRLSAVVLERAKVDGTMDATEADERQINRLAEVCKAFFVSVIGAGSFDKAQTTAGGVPLSEVDAKTLESVYCKGLYLCGELLDVDGICGGYNLTWAWASGYVCGNRLYKR